MKYRACVFISSEIVKAEAQGGTYLHTCHGQESWEICKGRVPLSPKIKPDINSTFIHGFREALCNRRDFVGIRKLDVSGSVS